MVEKQTKAGKKLAYILKLKIPLAIRYAKMKDAMDSGRVNLCYRS